MKIENLVMNHELQPVKLNPGILKSLNVNKAKRPRGISAKFIKCQPMLMIVI